MHGNAIAQLLEIADGLKQIAESRWLPVHEQADFIRVAGRVRRLAQEIAEDRIRYGAYLSQKVN